MHKEIPKMVFASLDSQRTDCVNVKFEYKRDIASVYETTGFLSNTEANFLPDVFVSFSVEVRMMLTWQTCLTLWDLPSSYPLPLREC